MARSKNQEIFKKDSLDRKNYNRKASPSPAPSGTTINDERFKEI